MGILAISASFLLGGFRRVDTHAALQHIHLHVMILYSNAWRTARAPTSTSSDSQRCFRLVLWSTYNPGEGGIHAIVDSSTTTTGSVKQTCIWSYMYCRTAHLKVMHGNDSRNTIQAFNIKQGRYSTREASRRRLRNASPSPCRLAAVVLIFFPGKKGGGYWYIGTGPTNGA